MKLDGQEEYVVTIIMAAGKDEKMKSNQSKLVHKIYDKELIKRVTKLAHDIKSDEVIAVVGHLKEQIEQVLGNTVKYVEQEELLGTGHAIMQTIKFLEGKKGKVVILNGDIPITRKETLAKLIYKNYKDNDDVTILTAIYDNPVGYGRIVRDDKGEIQGIVEERHANSFEINIKEINSGIYCFNIESLVEAIKDLQPDFDSGEYYLTDVIAIMNAKNFKIGSMLVEDNTEILEVNDKKQLELLTRVLRMRINSEHMDKGVTIEDSDTTYIYDDVEIGVDTVIHPNTIIKSGVIIGDNCEIGPNAYIRENCIIGNEVKIGNFVEIKNVKIGDRTKVPHLTYLGDTEIGCDSNVGCGTITCNYDGKNKNKTIIGDRAFIGSNVNLVAPVTLGDDVLIAAGSTITEDVPSKNMGIARERQTNKPRKNLK